MGTNAFLIWFLYTFGPRKVFNLIIKVVMGLNEKDLCKNVFKRGQRLVGS
jgi:hypothetical protein